MCKVLLYVCLQRFKSLPFHLCGLPPTLSFFHKSQFPAVAYTWAGLMDPSEPLGSWLSLQIPLPIMNTVSSILSNFFSTCPINPLRRWMRSVLMVSHSFLWPPFRDALVNVRPLSELPRALSHALVDLEPLLCCPLSPATNVAIEVVSCQCYGSIHCSADHLIIVPIPVTFAVWFEN